MQNRESNLFNFVGNVFIFKLFLRSSAEYIFKTPVPNQSFAPCSRIHLAYLSELEDGL